MPLQLGSRTGVLDGVVSVEEVEELAVWLRSTPSARINLKTCSHLHAAALQALMAAQVQVTVPPTDDFLRTWVMPVLAPEVVRESEITPEPEPVPVDVHEESGEVR